MFPGPVFGLVLVALCGCPKRPFLTEPGRSSVECLTTDSCIESAADAVTDDLRALGGPCLADIGGGLDREIRGSVHLLSHQFGKVTASGKLGPAVFEPPSACEIEVIIVADTHYEMSPTQSVYFTTKSGRMVSVFWSMAVQDAGLRASVNRLVRRRVKMLGEALERTD